MVQKFEDKLLKELGHERLEGSYVSYLAKMMQKTNGKFIINGRLFVFLPYQK